MPNIQKQNDGECFDGNKTQPFLCECNGGYLGARCELDLCSDYNCINDGECVAGTSEDNLIVPECNCINGFKGPFCKEHMCDDVQCLNAGKCVIDNSDINNIKAWCDCSNGYEGDRCQIDMCSDTICFNGGSCTVDYSDLENLKPVCLCPDEYIGDQCETVLGCEGNPCHNGGECKLFLNSTIQEYFEILELSWDIQSL